jgi:hypothetical protein
VLVVVELAPDVAQSPSRSTARSLVRVADARVQVAELGSTSSRGSRSPRAARARRFARGFARSRFAGRELDEHAADRIAELALDDPAAVVEPRRDQHRARDARCTRARRFAVGQPHVSRRTCSSAVEHRSDAIRVSISARRGSFFKSFRSERATLR